jgi:hypothetical protein
MNFPNSLTASLASAVIITILPSAYGDETYLISPTNLEEWKPPVRKEKVLPDRKVERTYFVEDNKGNNRVCIEKCTAPTEDKTKHIAKTEQIAEIKRVPIDIKQLQEEYQTAKLIFISATVYEENGKEFSHIRLQCEGQKVEAWSSMNFMEMAGMNQYVARGIKYHTHVGHGKESSQTASEAGCPVTEEKLNLKKARFVSIGDTNENPNALEAMRGLHAIYNKERDSIRRAYRVRVENQKKSAQWHAANPPKTEEISIRYWKPNTQKEEK